MDTLPQARAAYFRKLATEARAGAANMVDYGARQTLMQAASMWDLIAERTQERSSKQRLATWTFHGAGASAVNCQTAQPTVQATLDRCPQPRELLQGQQHR